MPATTHWVLAGTKVPTGETEPAATLFPNPQSIPLRDYNLDDVFSDLVRDPEGRAHFIVKGRRQQVEVMFGPNWRGATVWSPNPSGTGLGSNGIVNPNAPARGAPPPVSADPNFICFEPMAGISNGLNLAQRGLYREQQYVQAGGTWQESFWVKPTGF